jgi:UDP-glucose:(heptosyl)LPS alpha-1,3-glucosyltransferase
MRIGYAYLHWGPDGGIERASSTLALRMATAGHEVHFHCASSVGETGDVTLHHVRAPAFPNSLRLGTFAYAAHTGMRNKRYDITHSHGCTVGADVITAQSCHKAGLRILDSLRMKSHHGPNNFGIADRVRLHIERVAYGQRRYEAIIAVSRGVQRELAAEYGVPPDDVTVIPNGVDLERFPLNLRDRYRSEVRSAAGFPAGATILLFVGNEFLRKGLAVLLKAMHLIDRPDVCLLVAGGDRVEPYLDLARALGIDDRVKFLGRTTKVEPLYLAADCFVLPTAYEAHSLAMVEAAAAGLPLIITRVNGTEELLAEGAGGIAVEPEAESVAGALRFVVDDEDRARSLGMAARNVAERFTWERITQDTVALYERVLALRKQR